MTPQQIQALQIGAWIATISTFTINLIVHRAKLREFFTKRWKLWASLVTALLLWTFFPKALLEELASKLQSVPRTVEFPLWEVCIAVLTLLVFSWLVWIVSRAATLRSIQAPFTPMPQHPREKRQVAAKVQPPTYRDYTNDMIFGVRWSWSYTSGGQLDPIVLIAFCPNATCRHRLEKRDDIERANYQRLTPPISLRCRRCGFSKSFDQDWRELTRDVCYEIERRLNTGEYVNALREPT